MLAALDALGLALGLYAALVLRSIVFGDPIFWNLLWEAGPADWLPFLVPITWLVFWQAGLYAGRERRAGAGKVASSIVLVAAITLAFGWGTNYDFTTSGLIPTACVTCGARDRAPARRIRVVDARAAAAAARAAPGPARRRGVASRVARAGADLAAAGVRVRPRRLVRARARRPAGSAARAGAAGRDRPQRGRLRRGDRARAGRDGAPRAACGCGSRRRRPSCCSQRGEYVPGQGVPLFELRPPVLAGADWAVKKAFDLGVSFARRRSSGCRSGS